MDEKQFKILTKKLDKMIELLESMNTRARRIAVAKEFRTDVSGED